MFFELRSTDKNEQFNFISVTNVLKFTSLYQSLTGTHVYLSHSVITNVEVSYLRYTTRQARLIWHHLNHHIRLNQNDISPRLPDLHKGNKEKNKSNHLVYPIATLR